MVWFRGIVQIGSESVKEKNSTQEISRVLWEWNQFNAKPGGIRIQGFCAFYKISKDIIGGYMSFVQTSLWFVYFQAIPKKKTIFSMVGGGLIDPQ